MKNLLTEKKAKLTQELQQLMKQQQYIDAQILAHRGAIEVVDQLLAELEKESKADEAQK